MPDNPLTISLRAKKLGVLIRNARLTAGRSLADCATAIAVTPTVFEDYELGKQSPSLPLLEALAYYMQVPLDHFWGEETLTATRMLSGRPDLARLVSLRQRIIGTTIRQARLQLGLSPEALANQVGLTVGQLTACELGQSPIPLPHLEALANILQRPLRDFQDSRGAIGIWVSQQRAIQHFAGLSPELQEFIIKPINRPYLELALRLSEMSVEKLRAIGEGILEITL
jgi:transcriptional regulator with XRE-family HTH domain